MASEQLFPHIWCDATGAYRAEYRVVVGHPAHPQTRSGDSAQFHNERDARRWLNRVVVPLVRKWKEWVEDLDYGLTIERCWVRQDIDGDLKIVPLIDDDYITDLEFDHLTRGLRDLLPTAKLIRWAHENAATMQERGFEQIG
jgi:hypothetical protein